MKILNSKDEPLFLLGLLFVMCDILLLTRVGYWPTILFDYFLVFLMSPALLLPLLAKKKEKGRKTNWLLVADLVLWSINSILLP